MLSLLGGLGLALLGRGACGRGAPRGGTLGRGQPGGGDLGRGDLGPLVGGVPGGTDRIAPRALAGGRVGS